MDDQTRIRLGRFLAAVTVLGTVIAVGIVTVAGSWGFFIEEFGIHIAVEAVGLGLIILVALGTQPRNGAIWALAWAAFFAALQTGGLATAALYERGDPGLAAPGVSPADVPLGYAIAQQTVAWTWIPAVFILITLGLLLFPDGKPLSPRWRWVGWFSGAMMIVAAAGFTWLTRPWTTVPYDIEQDFGVLPGLAYVALMLLLPAAGLSVTSLVLRYRRSSGVTRHQIRWIAWGGSLLVFSVVLLILGGSSGEGAVSVVALAGEVLLIVSIAIAITRYRLYDIDIVISRTVTYGALALFITAVYVAIVVGVGSLFGQGDEPNLALAIAATAAVALLFEPLRRRLQRWANRLAYGERATPYSVLSELSARFSEAGSNEQALQRLAELLGSGTGATEAVVWLRVGDRLRPEAVTGDSRPLAVEVGDGLEHTIPGDDSEPVYHGGELLGALSISKERGQPVTPTDRQLLEDVAAGAGLLLRNIRLNAELAERAEELRMSRRRLVAAQDAERRRLERNLHDGAQQQVVALKVKLGLAKTLAEREDVDQIALAVAELSEDTQRAVDGMRAAARGIYPPLLEAEGIRPALTAAARDTGVSIDVDADDLGRYSPEVEATVYFSVLEAMSDGSRVAIGEEAGRLSFTIEGAAGTAGLATVADRMEALGGTLSVTRADGGESTVTGRLPVTELEPL